MNELPDNATVATRVRTLLVGTPDAERLDSVAAEAPLEIRIGGKPATVLMRTPGHDEELVHGFLFSEGLIGNTQDLVALSRPPDLPAAQRGNVIAVQLAAPERTPVIDRLFYSSSSCGVCGKKSIASLQVHGRVSDSRMRVSRPMLASLPERLKSAQPMFAMTGGVHASGLFTADGELLVVREDVGRHNALDKLIGWALAAGKVPLDDHILVVSGRVSYEIVQKAVCASLPLIAAVGAPSSLAVELAQRFNLTLVGFLRPGAMNVYAGDERVLS